MKLYKTLAIATLVLAVAATATQAHYTSNKKINAKELIREKLPNSTDKEMLFESVTFAPGQKMKKHRHPGPVIVYVLDGTVISQMEGDAKPITYKKGDYWYEAPLDGHIKAENPSKTKSATILAWLILGKNDPIQLPYEKKAN